MLKQPSFLQRRAWIFSKAKFVSELDGDWTKDLLQEQQMNGIAAGKIVIRVWQYEKTGYEPVDQSTFIANESPIHEKAKLSASSQDQGAFHAYYE